jgi:hypothetical protein
MLGVELPGFEYVDLHGADEERTNPEHREAVEESAGVAERGSYQEPVRHYGVGSVGEALELDAAAI